MNKMRKLAGKKLLLGIAVFLAGGFVRAQEAKDTLTLTLDKALEIALSENPTIKVADEEISLKEVANKETCRTYYLRLASQDRWIIRLKRLR